MSRTQSRIGIKASHDAKRDEFAKPSPEDYNRNHGRTASAPTKGGDRQAAYDALLRPGKAVD